MASKRSITKMAKSVGVEIALTIDGSSTRAALYAPAGMRFEYNAGPIVYFVAGDLELRELWAKMENVIEYGLYSVAGE